MERLSIVVPLYNEEDNVRPLCEAVMEAMTDFDEFELLLVNDGSSDRTLDHAKKEVFLDYRIKIVNLSNNFGQTAAMAAGIEVAGGDIIVTMDGDLQNDPRDIPRLLACLDNGYDIAVGWRRKRKDGKARVFVSKIANMTMARILGVRIKDSGCSLKAFRSRVIKGIPLYGEMHRFIPALCSLAGARVMQIEVNHRPRQFGVSKYGFSRIQKVFFDIIAIRGLLNYARRPLRWMTIPLMTGLGLSVLVFAWSMLTRGAVSTIAAGVVFTLLSFSLFILAWGLVGALFAQLDPTLVHYARLVRASTDESAVTLTKPHSSDRHGG